MTIPQQSLSDSDTNSEEDEQWQGQAGCFILSEPDPHNPVHISDFIPYEKEWIDDEKYDLLDEILQDPDMIALIVAAKQELGEQCSPNTSLTSPHHRPSKPLDVSLVLSDEEKDRPRARETSPRHDPSEPLDVSLVLSDEEKDRSRARETSPP